MINADFNKKQRDHFPRFAYSTDGPGSPAVTKGVRQECSDSYATKDDYHFPSLERLNLLWTCLFFTFDVARYELADRDDRMGRQRTGRR